MCPLMATERPVQSSDGAVRAPFRTESVLFEPPQNRDCPVRMPCGFRLGDCRVTVDLSIDICRRYEAIAARLFLIIMRHFRDWNVSRGEVQLGRRAMSRGLPKAIVAESST